MTKKPNFSMRLSLLPALQKTIAIVSARLPNWHVIWPDHSHDITINHRTMACHCNCIGIASRHERLI